MKLQTNQNHNSIKIIAIGIITFTIVIFGLSGCAVNQSKKMPDKTKENSTKELKGNVQDETKTLPDSSQGSGDAGQAKQQQSGDPWIAEFYLPLNKGKSQVLTSKEPFLVVDMKWNGPEEGSDIVLEAKFLQKAGQWTNWSPAKFSRVSSIYAGGIHLKQPATKAEFRTPTWYKKPITVKVDFQRYLCKSNCGD